MVTGLGCCVGALFHVSTITRLRAGVKRNVPMQDPYVVIGNYTADVQEGVAELDLWPGTIGAIEIPCMDLA
jgi:hypothetical protein